MHLACDVLKFFFLTESRNCFSQTFGARKCCSNIRDRMAKILTKSSRLIQRYLVDVVAFHAQKVVLFFRPQRLPHGKSNLQIEPCERTAIRLVTWIVEHDV